MGMGMGVELSGCEFAGAGGVESEVVGGICSYWGVSKAVLLFGFG